MLFSLLYLFLYWVKTKVAQICSSIFFSPSEQLTFSKWSINQTSNRISKCFFCCCSIYFSLIKL